MSFGGNGLFSESSSNTNTQVSQTVGLNESVRRVNAIYIYCLSNYISSHYGNYIETVDIYQSDIGHPFTMVDQKNEYIQRNPFLPRRARCFGDEIGGPFRHSPNDRDMEWLSAEPPHQLTRNEGCAISTNSLFTQSQEQTSPHQAPQFNGVVSYIDEGGGGGHNVCLHGGFFSGQGVFAGRGMSWCTICPEVGQSFVPQNGV